LITTARIGRPVRALSADGSFPQGVESRTVKYDGAYLTYLHNLDPEAKEIQLKSDRRIKEIFWLNKAEKLPGPTIELAPLETKILKLYP